MTIIINISTIQLSLPIKFLQIKLTFYNHRIKISFLRLWEYFEVDDDVFKVDYVGLRDFLLTLFDYLVVTLKKFSYDDNVLQQWYLLLIWKEIFIHICYMNYISENHQWSPLVSTCRIWSRTSCDQLLISDTLHFLGIYFKLISSLSTKRITYKEL